MDGVEEQPDIVLDVEDEWVVSFKVKLDKSLIERRREERCSIFEVPPVIRNQNQEAYKPRVVSIGPYHYQSTGQLIDMQMHKRRMARRLFSLHPNDMVPKCLQKIRSLYNRARSCYVDQIHMNEEWFTEMLVLDGCFIICVLLIQTGDNLVWWEQKDEEEEEIFNMHYLALINEDLIKAENQIPFFIVETLYRLLVPQTQDNISITHLFFILFKSFLEKQYVKMDLESPPFRSCDLEVHHLLHLFHNFLLLSDEYHQKPKNPLLLFLENVLVSPIRNHLVSPIRNFLGTHFAVIYVSIEMCFYLPVIGFLMLKEKIHLPSFLKRDRKSLGRSWGGMPNATELQEAGVKFTPKEDCSLLDVSFKNGAMKIPTFYISEHTQPILRNLIAFEQCHPNTARYFTLYANLMNNLIDTPKDVKVLQEAGILKIGLNGQVKVARLFNQLYKAVYSYKGTSHLDDMYYDVNCYCNSKWNRWKAILKRNYFSNPWTIISVVAAIIVLSLTILKTFYGIFGYYHPRSSRIT